jgi:NADH:ubiquinone oxidoreductase subunit E
MNNKIEIIVCMGSACFARGNSQNLEYIENYLKEHKLEATVGISGSRCEGKCAEGPNIIVNGIEYGTVDEAKINAIFEKLT